MNLISRQGLTLHLTLSRRNLLTLIKMLDQRVGAPSLHRRVDDDMLLVVTAEEDEQHYASEARQAEVRGVMGIGPDDVEVR